MKKEVVIELNKDFKNKISITTPYFEFIRHARQSAGSEAWAEYRVSIEPIEHRTNFLYLEVNSENEQLNQMIEYGLNEGINKFISELQLCGIGIIGFKIIVNNHSYHPVDSKPRAFECTIYDFLKRLLHEGCFRKEILQTNIETDCYKILKKSDINSEKQYYSMCYDSIIDLPRVYNQTVYLKDEWFILFQDPKTNETQFEVSIRPIHRFRLPNYMYFSFNKENTLGKYIFIFYEQLKDIKNEIYNNNINLGGLIIDINLHPTNGYSESTLESFRFAIIGILRETNNIQIKDEKI